MFFNKKYRDFISTIINNEMLLALVFSISMYFIFFTHILSPNYMFWGSDAEVKHYPAREYLYTTIMEEKRFPFWTEKMYLGFPIYKDMEHGYLNPINVLSILMFGPILSYKVLHILSYIIGSLSLYYLLKRKGFSLIGFLICNLIYYFSFFHLNHQIHYNIILLTYLLPLQLLLVDLFIERPQFRLVLFQAIILSYGIYWGQPQIVILNLCILLLYFLIFSFKVLSKRNLFFYALFLGFLTFWISFPQLNSTLSSYIKSERVSDIEYTQGSLTPRMFLVTSYPFIFGKWEEFDKKSPMEEYSYTEVYIYIGITSILLGVFGIIFNKRNKMFLFSYICIWIFLILGLSRYFEFLKYVPFIKLFRYWSRSIYVFSLGIGILGGYFLTKQSVLKKNAIIKGFILALSLAFFLILVEFLNPTNYREEVTSKYLTLNYLQTLDDFKVWFMTTMLGAALLLILPVLKSQRFKICITIAFFLLAFADLFYFGKDVLSARLYKTNIKEKINVSSDEFSNKRIILNYKGLEANKTLQYNFWSPIGYSQLESEKSINLLQELSISNDSKTKTYPILNEEGSVTHLRKMGIYAVVNNENIRYIFSENDIDLVPAATSLNLKGKYLEKKEGQVKMTLISDIPQVVQTAIKYDPDWKIVINDKVHKTETLDGTFLSIPINAGENRIQITYIPSELYKSTVLSSIALFAFYGYWKLRKFKFDARS